MSRTTRSRLAAKPASRGAGMGDDARLALRPRGVAIRAGSRRTARRRAKIRNGERQQPCRYRLAGLSGAAEELGWIDRGRAFADLEMQLRRRHVAGLSGVRNHLSALDCVAALDEQLARMCIGRHISIRVTDQNKIAVALELVAGISDDAVIGRLDRCPFGTARLMPSFCVPFGLLPKPAMTRPRAGQRNDGMAPLGSAAFTAVSVVWGSSLATCAVCTGAALATLIFFSAGAVRGSATLGVAGGWTAAT